MWSGAFGDYATAMIYRMRFSLPLGVVGMTVWLAGCGDLPRPFAHDRQSFQSNPLVALPSGVGVSVADVGGLPAPWNRLVALETAEILRASGIPAEAGTSARLGYRLDWVAEPVDTASAEAADGTRSFQIVWRLSQRGGDMATVDIDAAAWKTADPEEAVKFARPVIREVISLLGLQEEAPKSDAPPQASDGDHPFAELPEPPPSLQPSPEAQRAEANRAAEAATVTALTPKITEAPGDGVKALTEALTALIRSAGVRLTDDPAKATFAVEGSVTTKRVASGQDKVTLIWTVTDPKTGEVLGTVTQENLVPTGLLDKPWGPLAPMIAEGALEGVGDVLTGAGAP